MLSTRVGRTCRSDSCPYILDGRLPEFENGELEWKPSLSGPSDSGLIRTPEVSEDLRLGRVHLDHGPMAVELSIDERCNLYCPTCRCERIVEVRPKETTLHDIVSQNLEMLGGSLRRLQMLGSGEVFFSPFALGLLRRLDRERFPLLAVDLLTNGTLLTAHMWRSLGEAAEMIETISVSVDAATRTTYEKVRLGGDWDNLMTNLHFLKELRATGTLSETSLNFVVSERNFRDMPAFVTLGRNFEVDRIVFTALQPWASMAVGFDASAVHLPSHSLNEEFLRVVSHPSLHASDVVLGVPTAGPVGNP